MRISAAVSFSFILWQLSCRSAASFRMKNSVRKKRALRSSLRNPEGNGEHIQVPDEDEFFEAMDGEWGTILKREVLERQVMLGIFQRWENCELVLHSDGLSPMLVLLYENEDDYHQPMDIHICSQLKRVEKLRGASGFVLELTGGVVLSMKVAEGADAGEWVDLILAQQRQSCFVDPPPESQLENRLAQYEASQAQLLEEKAKRETEMIALKAQLEKLLAGKTEDEKTDQPPLPTDGSPRPRPRGPGPPLPTGGGRPRGRGPGPPLPTGGGRPRGRGPGPPLPANGQARGPGPPRPQGVVGRPRPVPGMAREKATPGEQFLKSQKEALEGTDVKLGDVDDYKIRQLLDVQFSKPNPIVQSDGNASASEGKAKTKVVKKPDYGLSTLGMRSVSLQSLLLGIEKKMGKISSEFLSALISKEANTSKPAITALQDQTTVNAWQGLIQEVQDGDVDAASSDDILLGKEPLPEQFSKISPPSAFIALLVGKLPRLRAVINCLATLFENREGLDNVHNDIAGKREFFANGAAGKLVETTDNAISNFLASVFTGYPKANEAVYKKIENALKHAEVTLAGMSEPTVLPLLFIANVLNVERNELRVRPQLMNTDPSGIWSPYLIDVFLSFANRNPNNAFQEGQKIGSSYLDEIQTSCNVLEKFDPLAPTMGAGVQWFQVENEVKTKTGNCKPTVPAVAEDIEVTLSAAETVSAELKAIMMATLNAAGSITKRLAPSEKELFEKTSKVAELKLQDGTIPDKFKDVDILDDENLRNVLLKFCTRVSEHVVKIGTFRELDGDL